jgi:hypothetical protein
MQGKLLILSAAFLCPFLAGCDILNPDLMARAIGKELDRPLRDFLTELRRVEKDTKKESEEWRKLIRQVRDDFKKP